MSDPCRTTTGRMKGPWAEMLLGRHTGGASTKGIVFGIRGTDLGCLPRQGTYRHFAQSAEICVEPPFLFPFLPEVQLAPHSPARVVQEQERNSSVAIVFFAPAVLLGAICAALVVHLGGAVLLAMLAYAVGGALGVLGLAFVAYHRSVARDRKGQALTFSWPVGHAAQGGPISMVPQQD
jgi:hypothetical protein